MAKKLKKSVLAEGESTGHAHVLDLPVEVTEREDQAREFNLSAPATVKHDEHKPVTLPPGDYVSDVVRETDPFEGERRAQD